MNEEERLAIAKERIEYILKTYDVKIFGDATDGSPYIELKEDFTKCVEINNV